MGVGWVVLGFFVMLVVCVVWNIYRTSDLHRRRKFDRWVHEINVILKRREL